MDDLMIRARRWMSWLRTDESTTCTNQISPVMTGIATQPVRRECTISPSETREGLRRRSASVARGYEHRPYDRMDRTVRSAFDRGGAADGTVRGRWLTGSRLTVALVAMLVPVMLSGCGSTSLPRLVQEGDTESAERVLRRSVEAHGGARWMEVEDIKVRYEGEWATIGPRIQPVLADTGYRRRSVEVIVPAKRIVGQVHDGPAGSKFVYRTPDSIDVSYDGVTATDETVLDAAALVTDAYQMFLTTPFFFDAFASSLRWAGTETVDGELCDRIAAIVRPGFGRADEDLALLSIGRESGILRRVRFTLSGLESTQGAEVDVTFRKHEWIEGILWATEYIERIRAPFKLPAHEWRLVSLETNTGADPRSPQSDIRSQVEEDAR